MTSTNSSVLGRLSRRDAFSEARRSYLEKFANLLVRADIDLKFRSIDSPAACAPHEDDDGFDVLIEEKKFVNRCGSVNKTTSDVTSGPLSDVSRGYIDAFLQEGLLYHELGHVLFTDFEALNDVMQEVPLSQRSKFHEFVNVYEDAVIEVFLREMFDCGTQLLVKNRVFHELYHADQKMWEEPFTCERATLATLPAYELGRYETGVLDSFESLPDDAPTRPRKQKEAVDAGIECFYDVVQLPDARERYERIHELFKGVWSANPKEEDELEDMNESESDNDMSRQDGQQMPAPDISPDEEPDEQDGQSGQAEELDEPDEPDDSVEPDDSGAGDASDEEGDEEEESVGGGESSEESDEGEEESGDAQTDSLVEELDESDVEDLQEETELDPDDGEDSRAEDIQSEIESVGAGENENPSVMMGDQESYDADPARVRSAERRAHHLEKVVRKNFRARQGDAERTGLTSGRFDSRQMISAARGSPRVFKQEDDPDEPDFQVVVAVDVSGSMGSNKRIEKATSVATTVTKAFEEAGGQSWAVRFGSIVEIVKTPSMRYDETKDAIAEASTSGSTNLLPLLEEYDEITESARNSFLFVVTDGRPGNASTCMDELSSLDDPTAILQISEDGYSGWHEAADAFAMVKDDEVDSLPDKAESLIRRLVETRGTAI